ncbi:DNA gyrase/topoisomerase IV subunit B [Calycomorphotria hydatis]|uniref:DNA topoisomerase (ATP-hydrolyzing) n=1 Tax=Calycomorphotria hydatis TaxID=2528027 RepID=A0A517TCG7_9PLAN|nr:DNA topoisomerase IV subunit B [Calycomorphotria hydatis]QDT66075.1 DNA gyrase subunit B [Calycomorphotria hydatis]
MSTAAASKKVATSSSKYKAADIEVLEGLEAVRRRPSMYIGGVDNKGLHHLIWEIVDNCVDEFLGGHTDRIDVTLHKDGQSVTVRDYGRGIPVDKHPKYKCSALEVILTTLHAGGKFSDKNYARSGGLHGVGSSVVNALSSDMTAVIHRDGHEWEQHYKCGMPQAAVKKNRTFRGSGTTIFFRPDKKIFKKTHFNSDLIRQHLEDIAYIHAGLKIKFVDESKKGETVEFVQPDGIKAYLEKVIADSKKKAVQDQLFYIEKDDGAIKVEVALKWSESTDEQIRSYVNGIRTHAGGTHESGLKAGVAKAVKNYMDVHDVKVKGVTIGNEDIREGLVVVLSVFHGDPMFQGQTKEKLNNPEVTAFVDGLVRPNLETWLNNNKSISDSIIGRIILAARARAASRAAQQEVRRKGPGKKVSLPGKLLDCRSKDRGKCELFIVEGDSAGGTAAMGRNGDVQAVLPLRGKILNTETLSMSKVLQNQEIKDLVDAMGTGIGPSFDLSRLRYERIILLMDADSDGYHISTLLLTFFFRHLPEIVNSGKLFIAQPPLYRITIGNQVQYARDDVLKEEVLESAPKGRKIEVQRFKGLGEMDAEQLRETTLDPKKRVLLKVEVESQVDAQNTFAQLLGKDASERYRVIMDEASLADDLDL